MSKEQLVDSHVSRAQCKKAIEALHQHALQTQAQRNEGQLIDTKEENIWLTLSTKRTHPEKKLKPHRIPVVHPIVDPRESPVCLITKDPQREYKDLLESHNIKFISRVVGITKLKGKWKPFEARRMLLQENGLFLADERVVPLLPGLLGKKFFAAKKQPIPVCLTRKDIKGELERAISSTYMHQNQGTCTSIKIGRVSQTPTQILENLITALPAIVKATKGEWDNIQSFNIKTNSSASLPVWQCDLGSEDGGRWHGFAMEANVTEGAELPHGDDDGDEESDEVAPPTTKKSSSKKRAAEDDIAVSTKKAKQDVKSETAKRSTSAEEVSSRVKSAIKSKSTRNETSTSDSPSSSAAAEVGSKGKKRRSNAVDFFDDPPVESAPTKKPKSRSSTITTSTLLALAPSSAPVFKAKRTKGVAGASDETTQAATSTERERKQKRDITSIGKKREKVKENGGRSRSVKATLLGKTS